MSITLKIVSGLVKGLSGHDLEALPKELGRLIGETIRGQFDQNGKLAPEAEEKLETIIRENPEVASEAMKLVLMNEQEEDDDSLLVDYLGAAQK